jgi:hypothetical protein
MENGLYMNMRRIGAALAAGSMTAVLSLVTAGVASASSNGQQLTIYTGGGGGELKVCGPNQNNKGVCSPRFAANNTSWTRLYGYYWKGSVTVYWTAPDTSSGSKTRNVPQSWNGTWYPFRVA